MESQTTPDPEAMRTTKDILTDYEAGRLSEAAARAELLDAGATDDDATELLAAASGAGDVIEVDAEEAAARRAAAGEE
jgi:hypothetical protein